MATLLEESNDPYLLWFWNSNVRSTAIALNSLVKANAPDAQYRGMVAWLLRVRKDGRWSNTQENALALESLVSYYRRFESTVPNFTNSISTPRMNPKSPMRLTMKAFLPASEADFFW